MYYYKDNEKIIFSSEIKAILSSGLVSAEFNEAAIDEYLANRYIRTPYTFFKNIYQIHAGNYVEVDDSIKLKEHSYWQIPEEFNTEDDYNEEKILNEFEEELFKAIKYRLISDVPLGTYLSGGIDSSLITAITAKTKNEELNTYTIGFPELNEFEYSRLIADQYNTSHNEILINKEVYLKNWENLISYKDAPLGVPNEIPLAVMSRKLKEKITVVLSGEGADELMGGYGRIFRLPFDFKNNNNGKLSFYEKFIENYEYVPRKMRDQFINTSKKYRHKFDIKISNDFKGKLMKKMFLDFFIIIM